MSSDHHTEPTVHHDQPSQAIGIVPVDVHTKCHTRIEDLEDENEMLRQHIVALKNQNELLEGFKQQLSEHLAKQTEMLLARQGSRKRRAPISNVVTPSPPPVETIIQASSPTLTGEDLQLEVGTVCPASPISPTQSGRSMQEAIVIDDDTQPPAVATFDDSRIGLHLKAEDVTSFRNPLEIDMLTRSWGQPVPFRAAWGRKWNRRPYVYRQIRSNVGTKLQASRDMSFRWISQASLIPCYRERP